MSRKALINAIAWLMGIAFGYVMSRAGATTYDFHARMFLLEDLRLMAVIGLAVLISMGGLWWMERLRPRCPLTGEPVQFSRKPWQRGLILGSILFGIGWGMTASCPGTLPAMLGEGKLPALFVFLGALAGTYLYGRLHDIFTTRS